MNELVFASLRARPLRTFLSVGGVALGVALVVLFTGLARGMSNDMQRRAANWQAEIVFTRPGAMEMTSSNASLSTAYVERLKTIEGVAEVVPVIRYLTPSAGRFGFTQIDGVDWEPFALMNEIRLVEGSACVALDEVVVDEKYARDNRATVGDTVKLFGDKPYRITGIFSPASGARIKMSLAAMQDALEASGKCTFILVKCARVDEQELVARRIDEALPDNKINLTRDLVVDAERRIPALGVFLRVLVGLAALVSALFVMLSMYTTIAERTREIGILKALGASRADVIGIIEQEAFVISLIGLIGGVAFSIIVGRTIQSAYELAFELSLSLVVTTALIAVAGSCVGALYPAWRAANLDPVVALSDE